MNEIIEELKNKIDRQEQYSRRHFILIYVIAENKEENTDQQAKPTIAKFARKTEIKRYRKKHYRKLYNKKDWSTK